MHVYLRQDAGQPENSLEKLASLVRKESEVLDVGMGEGMLGHRLFAEKSCVVDGITYNPDEAELGVAHYREIRVVDLEVVPVDQVFIGKTYDYIVCADVLEHLRNPESILAACGRLLKKDGRLLVSVPNVAHIGLVAELIDGEFRYRPEGLLDLTHLRFFTRASFLRFLVENGWQPVSLDTIQRDLQDSEFKARLEKFPPSLSRYLLSNEDAFTYQFIIEAIPSSRSDAPALSLRPPAPLPAGFTAAVYLETQAGWSEERKVLARGRIGEMRQTVQFMIPACAEPIRSLRLDPADRPGFLHLHGMRLTTGDGELLWAWDGAAQGLESAPHQQMVFAPPWGAPSGALVLLTGDDPHVVLPVPASILAAHPGGMTLGVDLGWPMAADFFPFAEKARTVESDASKRDQSLERLSETVEKIGQTLARQVEKERGERQKLENENEELRGQLAQQLLLHQQAAEERDRLRQALADIHDSTVIRMTRPIVRAKMALDALRRGASRRKHTLAPIMEITPHAYPAPQRPVDIVIPIYRGLEDTRRCIESVLGSAPATHYRLVLINDCSPEPEMHAYLESIRDRDPRILLLENRENLGFVGTVNRGMSLSMDADVVLLNSDTEVANDWLDRLSGMAYSSARIGTVTPFSNNATICSYPRFCAENPVDAELDVAGLDRHFATANRNRAVRIPTAVGFCMFIRRDCLNETGLFDVQHFGKGYGEENDFCMRASRHGWQHLHALDTFVLHRGGVSFGESKNPRVQEAMRTLRNLHPTYDSQVNAFIQEDPSHPARLAVDVARIQSAALPVVLHVLHARGGGTERHVEELAAHLAGQVLALALKPAGNGVELFWLKPGEGFRLFYEIPRQLDALCQTLRDLGVRHVHYHHLLGHAPQIRDIPARIQVGYDFTAHDYYGSAEQIAHFTHGPVSAQKTSTGWAI